jgi:hypothetical protein
MDATTLKAGTVVVVDGARWVVRGSCTLGDLGLHYRVERCWGRPDEWALVRPDEIAEVVATEAA